jgi:hypothetical protein
LRFSKQKKTKKKTSGNLIFGNRRLQCKENLRFSKHKDQKKKKKQRRKEITVSSSVVDSSSASAP